MTTLAERGLGSRLDVKRLFLLLFGPPGTAKTVNVHRMPRTRTLDFDDGMQSVEWAIRAGKLKRRLEDIEFETITENYKVRGHVSESTALDKASDAIDRWLAEEHIPAEAWTKTYEQRWDTLIVDSGSSLSDICIWKGLDENQRLNLSKSRERTEPGGLTAMTSQDWGAGSQLFQKFINWIRTLDKNVILVCHEYDKTDDEGKVVAIEPLLIGQLRQKIAKDFDEVWHAQVKGTKNDPRYVFQTGPDPLRRLRSRLGCLDVEEPADFDAIKKKVADFYHIDADMLWTTLREGREIKEPAPLTSAKQRVVVKQATKAAK